MHLLTACLIPFVGCDLLPKETKLTAGNHLACYAGGVSAFACSEPFQAPVTALCLQVEGSCSSAEETPAPDAGFPCGPLLCGCDRPAEGAGAQRRVPHCCGEPGQGPPGPGPCRESGHLLHQVCAQRAPGPSWLCTEWGSVSVFAGKTGGAREGEDRCRMAFLFCLFRPHLWHVEVPGPGIELAPPQRRHRILYPMRHSILCYVIYLFIYLFIFRTALTACGGSQARGRIRAAAARLCHSHSNAGSEPRL